MEPSAGAQWLRFVVADRVSSFSNSRGSSKEFPALVFGAFLASSSRSSAWERNGTTETRRRARERERKREEEETRDASREEGAPSDERRSKKRKLKERESEKAKKTKTRSLFFFSLSLARIFFSLFLRAPSLSRRERIRSIPALTHGALLLLAHSFLSPSRCAQTEPKGRRGKGRER